MRYYINNFTDGYYHDCLDIATLKLLPNSYLRRHGFITPLKLCLLAIIILVALVNIIMFRIIGPIEEPTLLHSCGRFLCIYGTFLAGMFLVYING